MSDRIQTIVTRLPDLKTVTHVWEMAQRELAKGDVAFVTDLGMALADRYGPSAAQVWQYRSVFDRLLRLLTMTPGPAHVEQAVRLVSAASPGSRTLARYAASLLAGGQTVHDLALVFAGGGSRVAASEELRACLVHELVLRGLRIAEFPAIKAWATSPHWRHHPLAWLPLELSVIEETPALPSYSMAGSGHSMPYGLQDGPGITPAGVTHLPRVSDTTTDEYSEAAAAAVANWTEESNGRCETATYDLAEPVETKCLPDLLMTLGLECLHGVGPHARLALSSCQAEHAWRVLFAAASTGGAYNNGEYGAYGRLAAWRSVAALSGASAAAPVSEVEANARACDWYSFGAATDWFERVAWDIGLVSVAPGARRLALLAATDTD